MRIKHPLQTLQKSGSLCLTPPPQCSLCTHSLLPALTKRRRKTRNSIMPLRGRITWGDACAAMPRVKSHVPSSPSALTTPLPLFTPLSLLFPNLAKDSPQKAHQNSPLMPWQAINPSSPQLQIAGDVTQFGCVGWQVCMCLLKGVCNWGGWVYCLFVLKQATSLMKWCCGRFETTHFCQFEK